MAILWYYQKDGHQHGPITASELKEKAASGGIGPDDLVRPDNRTGWAKATAVKGLLTPSSSGATAPASPKIDVVTADNWYFAKGGVRKGPVSIDQLRTLIAEKAVETSDLVWRDGMVSWQAAREIPGLLPSSEARGIPPLPPVEPTVEWYYALAGKKHGPATEREMKTLAATGQVGPSDLVWHEGMPEWRRASSVAGFTFPESAVPPSREGRLHSAPHDERPPRATPYLNSSNDVPSTPLGDREFVGSMILKGGKSASTLGLLAGLVGDFLEPLAPINGYLFALAALLTLLFSVQWFRLQPESRKKWDCWIPHQALVFCGALFIVFGIWFSAQSLSGSGKQGVLAANVEPIRQLQVAVLKIGEGVKDIKNDTTAILGETRNISKNVDGLGKLGGVIKNPETPADYYHNARIHELSGDFAAAFTDYQRYVTFNQAFVDPYVSYLELLRTQRGNQGATLEFAKLKKTSTGNVAVEFVALRLLAGSARLKELEAFAINHTDFAPVLLDLANYYSAEEMPDRTGVDIDREKSWLDKFLAATNESDFAKYYLDKKKAAELVVAARGRTSNIGSSDGGLVAKQKVFLWGTSVWVMDSTATSIEYSFDQKKWAPVDGLVKTMVLCRGGIDDPRMSDLNATVYVRYADHRGQLSRTYGLLVSSGQDGEPRGIGGPVDPSKFLRGEGVNKPLQEGKREVDKIRNSMPSDLQKYLPKM